MIENDDRNLRKSNSMDKGQLSKIMDHTLLKPNILDQQIEDLCTEAKEFSFASVCINPSYIPQVKRLLTGTGVKVCTVIGFPLGANTTRTKIFEAEEALSLGADELDYVVNIGDVLNERYDSIKNEMLQFVRLKDKQKGILIKIILETCYLNEEQISRLCQLAKESGLDFVKTSTGFGSGGATVEDVSLMRRIVGPGLGVKASGGVRSFADAKKMVEAGASRLGTSASVAIVTGADTTGSKGY